MSTHTQPHPRTCAPLALIVAALATIAAAVTTAPAVAAECTNEQFRTGYSAALPDCRAYELVSPPALQPFLEIVGTIGNIQKASLEFGAEDGTTASQSSADSGIAFFSTVAPPVSTTDGPYFLSSRGTGGWGTQNLIPPQATEPTIECLPYMIAWSANLERGVLADGFSAHHPAPGANCAADEPELVAGEPRDSTQNLFLRDSATGAYQLIDQPGLSGQPGNAVYQAGSNDLGVIVFAEEAALTSEVKYYVWAGGTDRLLTVLPSGQPTEGEIADAATVPPASQLQFNALSPTFTHAVAPDGSRIEFTAGGSLYSRVNPATAQSALNGTEECDEPSKGCTVQIDRSETASPGGGGVFAGGSGEAGSVVYFTDVNRLTPEATATTGEPDLYEYDFRKSLGNRLTDLTSDQNAGEHADVLGYVGSNEAGTAGEYVYFVATGVLSSKPDSSGALPKPGAPNLYMAHQGMTSFIATLSSATDSCDWENNCMTARVSPNGRYLGFNSLEQVTGFDNLDALTGKPDQEIFLYDGGVERLSCASCGTTGAAPIAPAGIRQPEGVSTIAQPFVRYLQRNVSDGGQVFYDTPNPLVPGAQNGGNLYTQSNVYEYEHEQLHLLSSGTAESSSFFYEASSDGGDVYLVTQQAVASDASAAELALYDARIDGGFPVPPAPRKPCSGEACSGPQAPGAQPPPAISSASLFGRGNLEPVVSKPPAVRSLTSAQKLANARKACRAKRNRHKRSACEAQARKKYGPHLKKLAKTNRRGK